MNTPPSWLSLRNRVAAVDRASVELLSAYQRQWPNLVPTELHRLSASLGCRISTVKHLEGGARLLPSRGGGFRVLVGQNLDPGRYRTAVAHELSHTLFYCRQESMPKRFFPPSKAEEHFCFDVARRLLAPRWMLKGAGLLDDRDVESVFETLITKFKLSRPVAARLILADYHLFTGVAGRWSLEAGEWKLNRGESFASPNLATREKRVLHSAAHSWLKGIHGESVFRRIVGLRETGSQSAFVLVEEDLARIAAA